MGIRNLVTVQAEVARAKKRVLALQHEADILIYRACACPDCKAAAGVPCHKPQGGHTFAHAPRKRLAQTAA